MARQIGPLLTRPDVAEAVGQGGAEIAAKAQLIRGLVMQAPRKRLHVRESRRSPSTEPA
jgi:hypothetical protein